MRVLTRFAGHVYVLLLLFLKIFYTLGSKDPEG